MNISLDHSRKILITLITYPLVRKEKICARNQQFEDAFFESCLRNDNNRASSHPPDAIYSFFHDVLPVDPSLLNKGSGNASIITLYFILSAIWP